MRIKLSYSKNELRKLLFYFAWGIYSISYLLIKQTELDNKINFSAAYTGIIYLSMLSLLASLILLPTISLRKLIKYIVFIAAAGLIIINRSGKVFLLYLIFILCSEKIDFHDLVKFDIKIKAACLFITVGLCKLGFISNYVAIINDASKQALGYLHPNTFSIMCFSILVEWIYLRYWKMKWWEWLAILAASMVVYKVAASRTSSYTFYLIYLLFALAVIAPKLYKIKLVKFLFTISTPVIAAVSFVMVILYMKGNSIGIAINEMLTGRLEFAAQFLNEYGVSLFGQEVELVSTRAAQELHISTAILDMSYIRAPIVYGIIFSVFFLVSFILLEKRAMKKGDIGIALFALFYIILGVAETYTIIPVFNISMLLMLNTYRSGFNELLEKIYKYKNLFS